MGVLACMTLGSSHSRPEICNDYWPPYWPPYEHLTSSDHICYSVRSIKPVILVHVSIANILLPDRIALCTPEYISMKFQKGDLDHCHWSRLSYAYLFHVTRKKKKKKKQMRYISRAMITTTLGPLPPESKAPRRISFSSLTPRSAWDITTMVCSSLLSWVFVLVGISVSYRILLH